MMTTTINFSLGVQRTPTSSSGEPSESNGDEHVGQSLLAEAEEASAAAGGGSSRPEPTRGVKKTPSLRRGAAAYAQLLQSAVTASIESRRDDGGGGGGGSDVPSPPPAMMNSMEVDNNPDLKRNKRSRHQEFAGSPRRAPVRRPRDLLDDSSDMEL
jgi:hypothetical protein